MLRLWIRSYAKPLPLIAGAVVSVVMHTSLITAAVIATLPTDDVPEGSIANLVVYIPPPDRIAGRLGSRETVHYVDITKPGPGVEARPSTIGDGRSVKLKETVGKAAPDSEATPEIVPLAGPPDSVFSILDVDSAVVRSANSAAPAYPLKLLQAHITGAVEAEYVVDTTGFADSASFRVLNTANPGFVNAVRAALPDMRFQPAKIGSMKVRQLVQQQFTFKINDTVITLPPRKKKP